MITFPLCQLTLASTQIAVLKEMGAKGPFSALVMGVVILKDVLVIIAFALNIQLVPVILGTAPTGGPGGALAPATTRLMVPLMSIASSISTGLVGGYALSLALEYNTALWAAQSARKLLQRGRACAGGGGAGGGVGVGAGGTAVEGARWQQMALVFFSGACIFELARLIDAEPLLACVTAGMLVANRRWVA